MKNLLLITGAGASWDLVDHDKIKVNHEYRPPLTKNLFKPVVCHSILTSSCIDKIIETHPIAQSLGLEFQMQLESGKEEEGLEAFLQSQRNHAMLSIKNRFWGVSLYLCDLFNAICEGYIISLDPIATNYTLLLKTIISSEKYDQLLWVNLNYDLFADFAIKSFTGKPFNNFEDYMRIETPEGFRIKYTKPHGSIDWFKKIKTAKDGSNISLRTISKYPVNLIGDFEERLSDQVYTNTERIHEEGRYAPKPIYFPAITAPLGDYEFVCESHKKNIIPDLRCTQDMLCIGFGALDKDILDLIVENCPRFGRMRIVNGCYSEGNAAYVKMHRYKNFGRTGRMGVEKEYAVFSGGFTNFIRSELKKWLREA